MNKNRIIYIINLVLILFIILQSKKIIVSNSKVILKDMDESVQETNLNKTIEELNESHNDYANYIKESKTIIARAITDMGVETSNQDTLGTMANNIKSININKEASSISYDNTGSQLISTNIQEAVDELDTKIENINVSSSEVIIKKSYEFTVTVGANSRLVHNINHETPRGYEIGAITPSIGSAECINIQVNYYTDTEISLGINSNKTDAAITRTGYILVLYIKTSN